MSQLEISTEILGKPVLSLPRHIKLRVFAEFLRKLREGGSTVILITHDIEILARYSERVILMNSGKVVADEETREILSDVEFLKKNSLLPTYTTQLVRDLVIEKHILLPEKLVRVLSLESSTQ
ncbi:MAG: hypothetical protein QN229_04330 [Desulfurococcaceae archaeon TW002]